MVKIWFVPTIVLTLLLAAGFAQADGILRVPQPQAPDLLLELVGVQVDVEIHDQVAVTTIRNSFLNESDQFLNGIYHFRVPVTAGVTGFGVWRGEELVEFRIVPGEQGGPGGGVGDNDSLSRFLGENPFSAPLDSIPPGLFMVFFRYIQLLPYDFGIVNYSYPLFTGRYLAAPIDTVSISLNLVSRREIVELQEASYQEATESRVDDRYHARAALQLQDVVPADDWRLNINYRQEDIGAWLYPHRSNLERPGYFMLVIDPGVVDTGEAVAKYFTFVLDRSGSMQGNKIIQACEAVLQCLNHLLPQDFFNIIDFNHNIAHFSNEMVAANEGNLNQARQYVNRIQAQGNTNIYGSLMEAVGQEMGEGVANQIIFTTDGLPTAGFSTNPGVILRDVTAANRFDARIYSFGIGSDVDDQFLAALSEANSGLSIMFDPREARIDSVISDFYRYYDRPALVNPVVTIPEEIEVDSLYPPELQNVSAGKQLYLFGRYGTFGVVDISLSGRMPEGDVDLTYENMSFREAEPSNGFVPRMWAMSVIDYWLRWMHIHGERQDIINRIIALSQEYGILTPYTRFGGDEEEDTSGGDQDTGGFAVEEPCIADWSAAILPSGIELSWTVVGAEGFLQFNVYRSSNKYDSFQRVNPTPLTECSFRDVSAAGMRGAFYKIEILGEESSWWSEVFAVGFTPEDYGITGAFPNPFNSETLISFTLTQAEAVRLQVYDVQGRLITTLIEGMVKAGDNQAVWNAADHPPGLYLVKLETLRGVTSIQKLILMK